MVMISASILVFMIIPIIVLLAFMPYYTRETVSFGVSVSEEMFHSEALRRLRKQFASISCGIYALILIACLIGLLSIGNTGFEWLIVGSITAIVIASLALNLTFHFKMKGIKATLPPATTGRQVVAIDTNFRRQKLVLSNRWFIIHAVITIISTVWIFQYYDQIPDTIPMKFDFQGSVINYADKSWGVVLLPNIMQVFMILIFMLINWSILNSKQQIDPGDPAGSSARNAIFRRRWSFFNTMAGLLLVLMFSLIQLNMIEQLNPELLLVISLAIPLVIVLGAVVLSFTTGQGGSRLKRDPNTPHSTHSANDDKYWKLGSVYFNPQDPALFVEKRFSVGWTINVASPLAWLFLAVPIVIALLTMLLV
ncbi:putative membrane protein [Paenibacillus sp. LBL]|uniref:DUF1648 domain-containing protein n=1 Tax=Paenibacillus sp. LBL TaxID=2940563 RepID=UPI002473856F|nr:DUF5808 domain-containing protein [Paenibacillus sp. LBL]MDH6673344.1 putative membrane protein [Paenibacillus sp. LBL]